MIKRLLSLALCTLCALSLALPAHAALSVFSGTFTARSGNGTQAITGVGFQPKVLLFYWARSTANATVSASPGLGFGMAVDTDFDGDAADTEYSMTAFTTDAVGTTDSAVSKSITNSIRNIGTVAPGYNYSATVTDLDSDGFTITTTGNDDTNLNIVKFLALGGSDITNVFLGEFTGPDAAGTGNRAFTGVGFTGNLGLFLSMNVSLDGGTSATDYEWSLGVAKSSSARAVAAVWGNDGSSSDNQAESYLSSTQCLITGDGGGLTTDGEADFVSWDADGFTLNYSKATTTGRRFFGLILKGTFQSAIATQARATADGTQDITSVGFSPLAVFLAGTNATASATETAEAHLSLGAATATASHGIWIGDDGDTDAGQGNATQSKQYTSATKVYNQVTLPSTLDADASLAQMLSNGYQLNWSNSDANARLFWHLALASAASTRRAMSPMVFQ